MPNRIRGAVPSGAALLAIALIWLARDLQKSPPPPPAPTTPQFVSTFPAAVTALDTRDATSLQSPNEKPDADGTDFGQFDRWAKAYLAASADQKEELLEHGIALATKRRAALKELIVSDPREALARAVPVVVRQDLPGAILAQLEQRVNSRGFFGVKATIGGEAAPIRREVRLVDGAKYDAYVYGRRAQQITTENAFINGVAIDGALALNERPLRVLEAGERPPSGKPIVQTCPISGKTTSLERVAGELPPITGETPAVELGGTIHYLCSGGHILAVEEGAVAQEGSTGGPGKPTGGIAATRTTGAKTHLYMRVTFPDQMTDPQDERACYEMMKYVNDFMLENSYGKCYFLTTVTPLLVMPRTQAWYTQENDDFAVLADARAAAKTAGYDPAQYDYDTVRYNGAPGYYNGQAFVGGKGCWLKTSSIGVACHEYGHNFGLWHANSWSASPPSVIGPGYNGEYGNYFDTMGSASGGDYHYGAYNKNVISWLTPELIANVTASGTYRIFAQDQPITDPARRYALKIQKDVDRTYWAEFRQRFTYLPWMMSGLHLTWGAWSGSNGGPQLLDSTPASQDGLSDSALVIGRTFSDFDSGIHLTPVGRGGTAPESLDVVVNLGTFPSDRAPTLSISATATSIPANALVTFSAIANDPDGDSLSYAWDFGDRTFSTTNAAVASKSWSASGIYNVRCTVSDMKGKVATRYLVVTVGSPGTFTISGKITVGVIPIEGVLVSNGQYGSAFRGAYSDSDGNYTISNVDTGIVALTAQLAPYNFLAAFTNPVTVGPNATDKDFIATPGPTLTLTALDATANESGDTGAFRITRTGDTTGALTVRVSAPSGTATRDSDYSISPNPVFNAGVYEVTMAAGSAALDITVTPINDTTQEGPETVTLQLNPGPGYTIAGSQSASIVLDDNDTTLPRVSITVPDEYGNESGDQAQFVISRASSTASSLTVQFAPSGTAVNATDYANIGTSIVIPAGASSVPLAIMPIDDSAVEGNETVTVTLSSNSAYVRDPTTQAATATINDNDINVLTVVATDAAAGESGDTGTFTITRTGDLTNALTVDYVLGGTALHGVDYQKLVGAATISAGEASTTVTVIPIDDAIGEPQQTVILQLRSGTTSQLGTPASATVTLSDNDLPAISVTALDGIAVEPASGPGNDTATFRIYRNGGSNAFVANYTVSGTATAGVDYFALTGSVAFAEGEMAKDITVTPLADAEFENTESVTLTLTPNPPVYRTEPENMASAQILDEDQVAVSVSTEDGSFNESSSQIRFWVSRSGATSADLAVNIQMSGTATPGVDYAGSTSTVTIPAGAAGVYATFSIVDDSIAEGTETVTMNILPAPGIYGIGIASATYLLADNDSGGLTQVRFSAASSSGSESVTSTNLAVTLSAAASNTVTVLYAISGGTATGSGVDYLLPAGVLQFDPGVTSQTIPITVIDDIIPEANETIVVTLSNPNAALLGSTITHTYTITDNDPKPANTVGFAGANSSALESVSSPSSIVVSLSAPATAATSVDYAVTGGTATSSSDFILASGKLNFAVGDRARRVPLTVVDDAVGEANETVVVTLSNASGATLGANTTHIFTITDDDASTVTVSASKGTATESGNPGEFTLTRAGSTTGPLAVSVAIGGSATNGADYESLPTTVNFAGGQSVVTLPVTPYPDGLLEGPETIFVSVLPGAGYTATGPTSASVTIAETDTVVAITASDSTASESGLDSGVFTVTRSGNTTAPLSVNLTLSGGAVLTTDYTASALPVVIPVGATSATLVITPIDDTAEEGTETVTATITPSPDYTIGAPAAATLNILDNDANTAPAITRVSPASASIGLVSGTGLILETTITDDGKPLTPGVVTATWTVQSGPGAATFGSPDQPNTTVQFSTSGTYVLRLTASDGALSSTLDVTINVDAAPDSTNIGVAVDAGPDVNVVIGEQASLSGTTTDDSKPQTPGAFTLSWSKVSGPGSVTFGNPTAAATTATASELGAYVLRLTASDGDVKTFDEVTLTNSLPVVSIQATDATASETGGDAGLFTITRSGNATAPLSVNVVLSGTALLNSDYTATASPLVISTGASSATIVITPIDDTAEEGTETVTATIMASPDYTISASGAATLNILDNDANTAPIITRLSPVSASIGLVSGTGLILETTITDDGKPVTPDAITTIWTVQGGPGTVAFGSPDQPNTTVQFSTSGTYVLRLTASDGALSSTLDVTINVDAAPDATNIGVAVDAGPDVIVVLGEQASLSGTTTDDGKPQPPGAFTLSWSKMSGPGSVTFGNPTAAATTVTPSDLGAYVLRLTANDGDVKTFDEIALTASLPVVSIQATNATANELGLERGTFTVTRTGPTASPLTVSLAATGTATPGVDYVTLPQTAVIQAGQRSTTIFATPLADGVAEGAESVNLTATPSTQYEVGTPSSATVVVEDLPIDAWRLENFGSEANNPSISGDLADPDGDGVPNILEWAQGTSPVVAGATRPELGLEPGFLTLTYRRSDAAVDLTFAVYESENLTSWAPASSTEETLSDDGLVRVIKARVPLGTEGHKLIRLQISR